MNNQLSPAAQAVLEAAMDYTPTMIDARLGAAAALLAVADQVVPEEPHSGESQFWDDEAEQEWQNNQHFRKQLLAIAAELEGSNG